MKAMGIVRCIDSLGRIVIPKELRTTMGISIGDPFEVFATNYEITLRKYQPGCIICGDVSNDMFEVQGTLICQVCGEEVTHKMSGDTDD